MWWAAVSAGLGAAIGLGSTWAKKNSDMRELKQQKENARKQYNLQKQYGDNLFSIRKEEALGQLDSQRKNLDAQLGHSIDDYNTNLLAQAYGVQDARIQNSSSVGMSLAAEGAGGTRGNAANEMMRAYASQGLERNIELQDRQNTNYLSQTVTGANAAADAIGREKDSWLDGGYKAREKAAQDDYNYKMFNLEQTVYDSRIQKSDPWNMSFENILDYAGAALGDAEYGRTLVSDLNKDIDESWNIPDIGNWFKNLYNNRSQAGPKHRWDFSNINIPRF